MYGRLDMQVSSKYGTSTGELIRRLKTRPTRTELAEVEDGGEHPLLPHRHWPFPVRNRAKDPRFARKTPYLAEEPWGEPGPWLLGSFRIVPSAR